MTVHPRVCGEQARAKLDLNLGAGSSPRVRGTVPVWWTDPGGQRFIPACAGNRIPAMRRCFSTSVHPRVCGEQRREVGEPPRPSGSSPRVRGTVILWPAWRSDRRFIPACAGNSCPDRSRVYCSPVHPRVCGEQTDRAHCSFPTLGSSPRVRGTGWTARRHVPTFRFIPACAGNRLPPALTTTIVTVHPRVCGEQRAATPDDERARGSSPRVRGTAGSHNAVESGARFIPACAGNSRPGAPVADLYAVHPRVCGEQGAATDLDVRHSGSSPRVRGTVQIFGQRKIQYRFIPACAGNRPPLYARITHSPVHPRVCGEQFEDVWAGIRNAGSSPRVRGTADKSIPRWSIRRFIPACAGNSPTSRR